MRFILSFCLIGLALFFANCSKKSTSKPASQVSSIKNSNGETWNFSYDGQGRVTTILYSYDSASFTKTFQYGKLTVFTSNIDQSGNVTIDTLELNSDGSIGTDKYWSGNQGYLEKYTYSNSGADTMTVTSINGNPYFNLSTSTFQGGDMISNSGGVTYTYYQNQPAKPLDDIQVGEYESYGNAAYSTKCQHMVQTYNTIYGTITFTYTYDTLGRVTQIENENAYIQSTAITWQ